MTDELTLEEVQRLLGKARARLYEASAHAPEPLADRIGNLLDEIDALPASIARAHIEAKDGEVGELAGRLRKNADTLEVEEDHDGAALEREAASRLESMAAERANLDPIYAYVREQINYWNKVAFDRRQAGRSDNFACAQASAFQHMEAFLNERFAALEAEGE